MKVTF